MIKCAVSKELIKVQDKTRRSLSAAEILFLETFNQHLFENQEYLPQGINELIDKNFWELF